MMNKIPKGWEVKKLGEICEITMGQSPKGENVFENLQSLSGLEFHQGKIYFTDKFISKSKFITSDIRKIAEVGSILLCVRAPVGIINLTERKIAIGRGLCALKANNQNNNFLYYYLLGLKQYFESKATGSTFSAITLNIVKNCEIPLPPLSEQKAIADKLDDSFAKIENAITNLINAKENLKLYKQSVLKSAFNGDLLPNTSPNHWEVKKLGEIFNVIGGGTPNTNNAEFWGGNISWISSADIDKENFNAIPRKFITENAIQNSATNLVPKNTIIVVTRVGLGKVAITKEPMCFSQDSQALIPFEKINVKFMAYQIKQIAQNFINISRGTTINGITKQNLKDCKICVPPLSEQNLIVAEIDRRFAIVDKTLNLIDKSIQNAKNLKQSILKKAFSGELRSEI